MPKHEELWTTNSGQKIRVCDMTEEHVRNALCLVIRRSQQQKLKLNHLREMVDNNPNRVYEELSKFMHDQDILGGKGASQ